MTSDWSLEELGFGEDDVEACLASAQQVPPPELSAAIKVVQDYVADKVEKGVVCPACDQHVKLYKRKLNANMVRFLCSLVLQYQTRHDWVSFKDCEYDGRDYPYVALWGLAETKENTDNAKKHSGLWKPTPKGLEFVYDATRVPSHVHLLCNRIIGWSEETTTARESLGKAFSYEELMK